MHALCVCVFVCIEKRTRKERNIRNRTAACHVTKEMRAERCMGGTEEKMEHEKEKGVNGDIET